MFRLSTIVPKGSNERPLHLGMMHGTMYLRYKGSFAARPLRPRQLCSSPAILSVHLNIFRSDGSHFCLKGYMILVLVVLICILLSPRAVPSFSGGTRCSFAKFLGPADGPAITAATFFDVGIKALRHGLLPISSVDALTFDGSGSSPPSSNHHD